MYLYSDKLKFQEQVSFHEDDLEYPTWFSDYRNPIGDEIYFELILIYD